MHLIVQNVKQKMVMRTRFIFQKTVQKGYEIEVFLVHYILLKQ